MPAATILIVEDNPVVSRMLQQMLTLLGYQVQAVEDGHQALATWRQGHQNLILTDLHMPVMDGFTLARSIREEESANGLPRTVIIAFSGLDDGIACTEAGMDDLLAKPAGLAQMRTTLARWLN